MDDDYEFDDEQYNPISPLGYIGFDILFAIPVIGWICIIVFSLAPKNKNVKNYARAKVILLIIGLIISMIFGAVVTLSGMSVQDFVNTYGGQNV